VIPYDDSDFETLYRNFIEKRRGTAIGTAFDEPALREDIDRELLDASYEGPPPILVGKCEHGSRPAVCSQCYWEGNGYNNRE
jgi:hypothetical protein